MTESNLKIFKLKVKGDRGKVYLKAFVQGIFWGSVIFIGLAVLMTIATIYVSEKYGRESDYFTYLTIGFLIVFLICMILFIRYSRRKTLKNFCTNFVFLVNEYGELWLFNCLSPVFSNDYEKSNYKAKLGFCGILLSLSHNTSYSVKEAKVLSYCDKYNLPELIISRCLPSSNYQNTGSQIVAVEKFKKHSDYISFTAFTKIDWDNTNKLKMRISRDFNNFDELIAIISHLDENYYNTI